MRKFASGGLCLFLLCAVSPAADNKAEALKGNTQFALELYAKIKAEQGNLFVSPYSISTAFAMTSLGAKSRTLEQMEKTLQFKDSKSTHEAYAAMIKMINGEGIDPAKRSYELSTANMLWGATGAKWAPDFLGDTNRFYGAGLKELDFATKTEESRQTINKWVEKETKEKIKDLIPMGDLTSSTQLVLTNAIYFKGKWAIEFDKKLTKDRAFSVNAAKKVNVPMMHITSGYSYLDDKEYQVLEMPYKGKDLSMVIMLPKDKNGLAALEQRLNADFVSACLKGLRFEREVEVALPKFKMTKSFELNKTMTEMGMADAFDARQADFSAMNGVGGLFLSRAIHKAFVEVNEEGTEAAASTAIFADPTSAVINPKPTPKFVADHPFVFMIKDNRSGVILFMGRVAEPKTE
jgi:serpin B